MENLEIAVGSEGIRRSPGNQRIQPLPHPGLPERRPDHQRPHPPLAAMVEAGEDLTELPGIGKEMAGHIRELVEWGELSALEAAG